MHVIKDMGAYMKIAADNKLLEYSGRIDFEQVESPEFVYPCSYVKMRFTGTSIKAFVTNKNEYLDNYVGVILDGIQKKILLSNDASQLQTLLLGENLENKEHEVLFFKRMYSCHMFRFYGFEVDDEAQILPLPEKPHRKIEIYGDSVSAGEVSEAVEYVGKPDPEWHQGEFSNSWYSYAWMTARKLNAQIHDIAQGGIALLDNTGWFCEPNYLGLESTYDKIQYNPAFQVVKQWDFTKYKPHVVIVAIGQNDSHPFDYMAENYYCEEAKRWREHYQKFVGKLREIYPKAEIILTTTILQHDDNWDRSIEEVCESLNDSRIHHFLYTQNGSGTPGHIRIPEAEQMAEELSAYIESLGEDIWHNE